MNPEAKLRQEQLDRLALRMRASLLNDPLGRKVGYEMAREEILAQKLHRLVHAAEISKSAPRGSFIVVSILDEATAAG
jgi:hypothetical protein